MATLEIYNIKHVIFLLCVIFCHSFQLHIDNINLIQPPSTTPILTWALRGVYAGITKYTNWGKRNLQSKNGAYYSVPALKVHLAPVGVFCLFRHKHPSELDWKLGAIVYSCQREDLPPAHIPPSLLSCKSVFPAPCQARAPPELHSLHFLCKCGFAKPEATAPLLPPS